VSSSTGSLRTSMATQLFVVAGTVLKLYRRCSAFRSDRYLGRSCFFCIRPIYSSHRKRNFHSHLYADDAQIDIRFVWSWLHGRAARTFIWLCQWRGVVDVIQSNTAGRLEDWSALALVCSPPAVDTNRSDHGWLDHRDARTCCSRFWYLHWIWINTVRARR